MFAFGYKAPALSPFDPAQGRLPSRLVRFNDASDPSCDRSHSAVLLVGHGPHFDWLREKASLPESISPLPLQKTLTGEVNR